jgi:dihydroorotate dehydrogenase
MLDAIFDLARPMLFALGPEQAHEMTLRSLEAGVHPRPARPDDPRLAVTRFGLAFPNPIGIAAGFDKDARVPDAVLKMGFGFVEVGSITPRPQEGNPRPRVFRLMADRGVINRLGFNNAGHAAALGRLQARPRRGVVGVNVGANKDAADRTADYVSGLKMFLDVASYITINISSPNTPGLRDLQAPAALDALLGAVVGERTRLVAAGHASKPLLVKIAPDVAEDDLPAIVERLEAHKIDGIIVSNTTLARDGLREAELGRESGGLSGRPLFHRSTVMLAKVAQATGGRVPLIGVGGVDSPETALAKIEAGASLVQLYTGLIYEGPGLIARIKDGLVGAVSRAGLGSVQALVGTKTAEWARRSLVA